MSQPEAVVDWDKLEAADGAGAEWDKLAPSDAHTADGGPEPADGAEFVPFRSGFACLVGRPNAGKSTLTNALVGQKVAIASSKPQTTRHAVRGIVTRPDAQLVLIDTPGLSKPRALLQERLNDLVRDTWGEVDVIGVCLPADQHVGPGDEFLLREIAALGSHRPQLVALATKSDLVSPTRMGRHLLSIEALAQKVGVEWAHIVPCSAVSGEQIDEVADVLVGLLPPGPKYYPDDRLTDEP
ncbi:MAG: 50S ribosome-binding GTPase, partial [Propionibacteriaceae bacterium]|nr:50S ribosome-binding GTPase [Propionibacteriaceae bacterium]